eukprot:CAMPEP_0197055130 /NCGR_PEP_ID=MMETSP1384-20130603/57808_1 /TAXON_ID=29189 /ORGANISM="Ammonia sp." /LENGTH=242 /DNA_ID=CAMNT_0042488591 /DNA_START=51 /DNA_END=776 /DNA_ORIENTATION=-
MGAEISHENRLSQFVIRLNKEQIENGIISEFESVFSDERRLVFISLIGLYQTYRQCPMVYLYPCICMLPIRRPWIYNPLKYKSEIHRSIIGQTSIFQGSVEFAEFLQLLQFKDSQGLLFCTLSDPDREDVDEDNERTMNAIHPFWRYFSQKLVSLNLNGLDSFLQREPHHFKAQHNTKYIQVLKELYCLELRFDTVSEIIAQTNGVRLRAITAYTPHVVNSSPKSVFTPSFLENEKHDTSVW